VPFLSLSLDFQFVSRSSSSHLHAPSRGRDIYPGDLSSPSILPLTIIARVHTNAQCSPAGTQGAPPQASGLRSPESTATLLIHPPSPSRAPRFTFRVKAGSRPRPRPGHMHGVPSLDRGLDSLVGTASAAPPRTKDRPWMMASLWSNITVTIFVLSRLSRRCGVGLAKSNWSPAANQLQ